MEENKQNALDILSKKIDEKYNERIIVLGDLNARTANEKGANLINEKKDYRVSQDKKLNADGKSLIEWCKKNGLCVLNGKMEGEYTYYGKGNTVIDYGICNMEGLNEIDEFKILKERFSEYMALLLFIKKTLEVTKNIKFK